MKIASADKRDSAPNSPEGAASAASGPDTAPAGQHAGGQDPAVRRGVGPARIHLVLMLVLTFSTGIVDAVGYLGYDKVFTGNMTGNVVILGMGLTGAEGLPVLRPALALVGFMVGALVAGRVLATSPKGRWTGATTAVLGVVTSGCIALAVLVALGDPVGDHLVGTIATTGLAIVMGMQAAAARRIGVADVTTVVVTSTIVGLAAESKLAGGDGDKWPRRLLAVVLITAGAAVGALTLLVSLWLGIALTAAVVGAVTIAGHVTRRRSEAA